MNYLTAFKILGQVKYKDWFFDLYEEDDGRMWLRVRFYTPEGQQTGRKWIISKHMTKSEVVTTALKAVLTAEEHEAREEFRYKGARVFGPHLDVDALAQIAGRLVNLDLRPEPVEA